MSAKSDSMIFPVALMLEPREPTITARASLTSILDVKTLSLDKATRIANEIGNSAAPGLPPNPRQRTYIPRDFKYNICTEKFGDLFGVCAPAQFSEKLLCDSVVMLLAHPSSANSVLLTVACSTSITA
jgi:hypothetical protein